MENQTPMELANENPNPNRIGQWKPKPQFNHKNQIILIIYQNLYPKFTCPMETKPQITHRNNSISLFPHPYSQGSL